MPEKISTEKKETKQYSVIGMMSGTSLDGLDIALCSFEKNGKKWEYAIKKAVTIAYPSVLRQKLGESMNMSGLELSELDVELGKFFGVCANEFLSDSTQDVDFIASHGHTIFHMPMKGLTKQIGSGAVIAAETKKPVICDFRSTDVALGGQGAPLVPIGDEILFPEYDICLNLGGFSNLSLRKDGKRIAYDVAPNNMALNYLTNSIGIEFDKDGEIARNNKIDATLLKRLDSLGYYMQTPPKSLGKEWFESIFKPVLEQSTSPIGVKIATVTSHIVHQLANNINQIEQGSVLITGGGAKNKFLIESLKHFTDKKIIIPDPMTIDYKEALIFAFLGVLRYRGEKNCLKSVTGAACDSVCGAMFL